MINNNDSHYFIAAVCIYTFVVLQISSLDNSYDVSFHQLQTSSHNSEIIKAWNEAEVKDEVFEIGPNIKHSHLTGVLQYNARQRNMEREEHCQPSRTILPAYVD